MEAVMSATMLMTEQQRADFDIYKLGDMVWVLTCDASVDAAFNIGD